MGHGQAGSDVSTGQGRGVSLRGTFRLNLGSESRHRPMVGQPALCGCAFSERLSLVTKPNLSDDAPTVEDLRWAEWYISNKPF